MEIQQTAINAHSPLTGTVTVDSILPKHVQFAILSDDAAAAIVAGCADGYLALQLDHFLGLVRLWLPATLGCEFNTNKS